MAFLLNPFAVYSTLTLPEQFRPLEPTNNATGNSIIGGSNNSSGTDGKNSPLSNTTRDRNSSPTILQCTLAGAIGGVIGDTSVHSLDTVKTRQQGAFDVPKYKGTFNAYKTIWKEEGFFRGLYSGYSAAMLGSLPSSTAFFFVYEGIKRIAINNMHLNESVSYLGAGFLGDFVSSIFYVPSEVLKTRLQLQGRHNNPHYISGYNYTGLFDAAKTIIRDEGWQTLFYGYKATLFRDLPFSALQFTFYENFRDWAFELTSRRKNHDHLPTGLEMLTGAAAGGLAGTLTTPFDVVKTRMQTQNGSSAGLLLTSNSLFKSLGIIYQKQGLKGSFSGVGPRFVWTSIQSSIMLLLYQTCVQILTSERLSFD